MIKFFKSWFYGSSPQYIDISELSNRELIVILKDRDLPIGEGNKIVLKILERLVNEIED